jgi:hypothetical protein
MKSRMKSIPANVAGYVVLIVILTAGAAQSLAGTNTVDSGDIIDGTIATPDLKTGAVSGSKILDNSITGADVAADAVGSSELAAGAVIPGKVAADAIGAAEIASNAVQAPEIAANAVGNSEMADAAIGSAEVSNRSLTLDDFATAEDTNLVTTTSINANSCATIATGLSGTAVGDLPIVVLRSATAGTFWEGLRVTVAGQFPLRGCNTTDANLASATSTIEVFTVRP